MDKTLEIVEKELTNHRLTVTPTRITIKFRLGTSDEEKEVVSKFFLEVAKALEGEPHSMRGYMRIRSERPYAHLSMRNMPETHRVGFAVPPEVYKFLEKYEKDRLPST